MASFSSTELYESLKQGHFNGRYGSRHWRHFWSPPSRIATSTIFWKCHFIWCNDIRQWCLKSNLNNLSTNIACFYLICCWRKSIDRCANKLCSISSSLLVTTRPSEMSIRFWNRHRHKILSVKISIRKKAGHRLYGQHVKFERQRHNFVWYFLFRI